jgi:hypothetical protein
MLEQRNSIRQKSLLRGLVYLDNSPCAVECSIRDISETGARLKFVVPPLGAVESLELQIPLKAQRHRCTVAWQRGDELGVAFAFENGAPSVSGDENARIARLEVELAALKQVVRRLQREMGKAADLA